MNNPITQDDFTPLYVVTCPPRWLDRHETHDVAGAIEMVEKAGEGRVVKFRAELNMPHCLPRIVHKSCGMWTYSSVQGKMKWQQHYIYDGVGAPFQEGKPD